MEIEEIIRKLRKARPEISREEFLKMVEERKKSLGNYFTEETIAKLVASEFGVKFSKKFEREFKTRIKHLVSGLNDVTVSGKILSIYPAQTFRRGLDKEGKVARLVIADQTGKINVVLWDKKADFVRNAKLRKGQRVRISHGYVRESRRGGVELHVGEQGEIEIIEEKNVKIADLNVGDGPVNLVGEVISQKPLIRKVKTSKGEEVPVVSFEIKDETGRIWVSVWRELAEKIEKEELKRGIIIKLDNFYVKKGFNDELEVFSRRDSSFEIISKPN